MKKVTIVIPVYNEAENLVPFMEETSQVVRGLSGFDFTWLFVNDGSRDGTLAGLKKLSSENDKVKYLSFSRNFGKESAIYAGLKHADGDYVILMDGDLQHPPALIPDMLDTVAGPQQAKGPDSVASLGAQQAEKTYQAAGAKRKPGLSSRMFASLNNKVSGVKLEKGATDFMCMSRQFVDAVLALSESQRFSKGLFAWVGFEIKWFDYEEAPRRNGKSKWSSAKLFSYAADGITSFSILPLKIVTIVGAIICALAFIYIVITLVQTIIFGIDVPGYVTTLCAILFLGGLVLLAIGILGAYIGRIYLETKDRPLYILQETNLDHKKNHASAMQETNLDQEKSTDSAEQTDGMTPKD